MRSSKKNQEGSNRQERSQDGKKAFLHPQQPFHFEMGKKLAENLGYPADLLDRVPKEAIDNFTGVGYYFHLIEINEGDRIIVLGKHFGMDAFIATAYTGQDGQVASIDMIGKSPYFVQTPVVDYAPGSLRFFQGPFDAIPVMDRSVDVVISNGMIHQVSDKGYLFREIARILRPGGKMVLADIVSNVDIPPDDRSDAMVWAAQKGGAVPVDQYTRHVENSGLKIVMVEDNPQYVLLSRNTWDAARTYGIKSISLLAMKP